MFETLKKLKYGARVALSGRGGEAETINVAGRATVIRRGGDGPPGVDAELVGGVAVGGCEGDAQGEGDDGPPGKEPHPHVAAPSR